MADLTLILDLEDHEDAPSIRALRLPEPDNYSYFDPELVEKVAEAIRQYPVWDAPQWLSPIAALRVIEDHLLERGTLRREEGDNDG